MNLNEINKKRKRITIISLLLTLLIVGSFVFIILFFSSHILVVIFSIIMILALLYCLSKFLVYKQYLLIKTDVINYALKKQIKCNRMTYNTNKPDFIYHFYNKNNVNIKSSVNIIYDEMQYELKEFEVTAKRQFKSDKVSMAGKYLRFRCDNLNQNCCFILNNQDETQKYIDYYSCIYQNKKDYYFSKTNKQYICMYNDSFNDKFLNVFDKTPLFHALCITDNIVEIIYIEKMEIFDFKLQNKIDDRIINYCSNCFEKFTKLMNLLRKVND